MTTCTDPLPLPQLRRLAPGPSGVRPFPGTAARSLPAGVYWRRRLVALAVIALLALGVATLGRAARHALGGEPLTAAGGRAVPAVVELDVRPVARSSYVVRAGDTLWAIARRIQPTGDVRPLVDELASSRHGRPLQPGERITVPAR